MRDQPGDFIAGSGTDEARDGMVQPNRRRKSAYRFSAVRAAESMSARSRSSLRGMVYRCASSALRRSYKPGLVHVVDRDRDPALELIGRDPRQALDDAWI
jgi:hypothetical protein